MYATDDDRHRAHRLGREAAAGDRAHRAAAAPGGGRERAELTPTGVSALATRRAPRAAHAERAGRDRARQAADRDPHAGRASSEAGLLDRAPRPDRRPQLPGQRQRRRPRAAAPPARAQERLPGAPPARPSGCRRARRWSAPPRSSSGCWRTRRLERRRPPHLRLPRGPQLPALLRRPGDLALGQLDADGRRDLADPQPHRQRRRGRPDHRAAVPADAALRRLGRAARRPLLEATPADRHPGADGDAGARRCFAVTAAGVVAPWMVYVAVFAMRRRQRRRQPDPPELRRSRWSAPTGSSTRSASTASSSRRRGSSARRSPAC